MEKFSLLIISQRIIGRYSEKQKEEEPSNNTDALYSVAFTGKLYVKKLVIIYIIAASCNHLSHCAIYPSVLAVSSLEEH